MGANSAGVLQEGSDRRALRQRSAASDPDDNTLLECAESAKAQYLVAGNSANFPRRWKYTEVITPRIFINICKDIYGVDRSG